MKRVKNRTVQRWKACWLNGCAQSTPTSRKTKTPNRVRGGLACGVYCTFFGSVEQRIEGWTRRVRERWIVVWTSIRRNVGPRIGGRSSIRRSRSIKQDALDHLHHFPDCKPACKPERTYRVDRRGRDGVFSSRSMPVTAAHSESRALRLAQGEGAR